MDMASSSDQVEQCLDPRVSTGRERSARAAARAPRRSASCHVRWSPPSCASPPSVSGWPQGAAGPRGLTSTRWCGRTPRWCTMPKRTHARSSIRGCSSSPTGRGPSACCWPSSTARPSTRAGLRRGDPPRSRPRSPDARSLLRGGRRRAGARLGAGSRDAVRPHGGDRRCDRRTITPGAADELADPAGLVSAGAFTDITGLGLEQMDVTWVDQLHHRHPGHDLRRRLISAWRAEGRAVPDGRAATLTRYCGFIALLRLAPLEE